MSMRYIHSVVYACDSCGMKVIGKDHDLPSGWTVEHGERATLHYCAECAQKNLAPVPLPALQ